MEDTKISNLKTKLSSMNKIVFSWQLIASILLGAVFMIFYTKDNGILNPILLTISGSLLVASLILYETKVHLSLMLLFASELVSFLEYIAQGQDKIVITTELTLSFICLFSGTYFIVKKIRQNKEKINIKNIVETNIKPYKIPMIAKIIILSCMVTIVFTLANSYQANNQSVTLTSLTMILMPTFIILLSIIPIKEVVYLRLAFHILEISILVMAVSLGKANIVMFIQPVVYIVSIAIGKMYRLDVDQHEPNPLRTTSEVLHRINEKSDIENIKKS